MRLEELSPLGETDVPIYAPLYLKQPDEIPMVDLRTRLVLVGLGVALAVLVVQGLLSGIV